MSTGHALKLPMAPAVRHSDPASNHRYDHRMAPPAIDIRILDAPVAALPFEPFPQPAGAECVFLGRTRIESHADHGRLVELSYEAYRPMALRVLTDLAGEAIQQFGCAAVRIHHAVGIVPPGEASVLVQVVCGHRDKAFEACRFLIDRLKDVAPIWKCEKWEDGTTWAPGQPVKRPAP